MPRLITILGPTATGKTRLAAQLASKIDGEIISADSRQVYRGLDIGSGKDLEDYQVHRKRVPYHLIDICDIGHEYSVFEFQEDFHRVFKDITKRGKNPILCGGTGLYVQAVLDNYKLYPVPPDPVLRKSLENRPHAELIRDLEIIRPLHNTTDTTSKKRTIRALEIAYYCKEHDIELTEYPSIQHIVFGIALDREEIKRRITLRLRERLKGGMIEEVEGLLNQGARPEQLKFYGLEYKLLTQYLIGELNYNNMYQKLNTAIHQFAKRQMTWFRKMEREGHQIHWIDGKIGTKEKINEITTRIN